jgi:hypothetical protein
MAQAVVHAHAQYYRVVLQKVVFPFAEVDGLNGTGGGVVLGIEIENDVA